LIATTGIDNESVATFVAGLYRNGKIELLAPVAKAEGSLVIVTWVQSGVPVDVKERGIDEVDAADLRKRLTRFFED